MKRSPADESTLEATFCFADLSGFSALTEAHGDSHAVDCVVRFEEIVRDALQGKERLMKTVGDAVLVAIPEPEEAVSFVSRMFEACSAEKNFPVLRVGLHHGRAVERSGDVIGAAINLTARIAAHAQGDQVLATGKVAQAAGKVEVEVSELGPVSLRNLRDPVDLYELVINPERCLGVIDPVCRMRIHTPQAKGRLRVAGTDYWFCSLECASRFAESPESYLRR